MPYTVTNSLPYLTAFQHNEYTISYFSWHSCSFAGSSMRGPMGRLHVDRMIFYYSDFITNLTAFCVTVNKDLLWGIFILSSYIFLLETDFPIKLISRWIGCQCSKWKLKIKKITDALHSDKASVAYLQISLLFIIINTLLLTFMHSFS